VIEKFLRTGIQSYVQSIKAETLRKIVDNKARRVAECQQEKAKHF